MKKVYLIYMDETQHVHWHLIPRYNEKGYDVIAEMWFKAIEQSLK